MTNEIIEIENSRNDEISRQTIHLYKEGTFVRAYNWSAWLCCRYLNGFKVNKRVYNGIDNPVVYIGFPETSMTKWIKDTQRLSFVDEKHMTYVLDLESSDLDDGAMKAIYDQWYNEIPLIEQKKKVSQNDSTIHKENNTVSITDVMRRIISFPIENKSPIECMLFLADLKKELSTVI